jgi:hypothetical protein
VDNIDTNKEKQSTLCPSVLLLLLHDPSVYLHILLLMHDPSLNIN